MKGGGEFHLKSALLASVVRGEGRGGGGRGIELNGEWGGKGFDSVFSFEPGGKDYTETQKHSIRLYSFMIYLQNRDRFDSIKNYYRLQKHVDVQASTEVLYCYVYRRNIRKRLGE